MPVRLDPSPPHPHITPRSPADEKHHKYNPEDFRDQVVVGLNQCGGSFEAVSKFLDQGGNNLEYNRYGEALFDILFCGGTLCM